jgi:polyphenol oxidase
MVDTSLPQPSGRFEWLQVDAQPTLACEAMPRRAPHLITTRRWALGRAQEPDAGAWAEVERAIGRPLVRVRQVHGADVLVRHAGDAPARTMASADIIVSDDPTTAIAIQTADCVPLLIADRRTGAVAAAHAGWRGLAAGVPAVAVDALCRHFGSRSADLVAAAGPSIGACCYEVGPEVFERFTSTHPPGAAVARWFFRTPQPTPHNRSMKQLAPPKAGHWFFDSWRAVRDQLEWAGIAASQIFVAELCTASHKEVFCSYRRDGASAGRMAAVIGPEAACFQPPTGSR